MEKINYINIDEKSLMNYFGKEIDTSDMKVCRKPLFHGTSLAALECDLNEIKLIHDHSIKIMKAVKEYYFSNEKNKEIVSTINEYRKTRNTYFCEEHTLTFGEMHNYEYGDFYVTINFLYAVTFSNIKIGEVARFAYFNAVGLRDLKIDLGIEESINYIISEYNKFKDSPRVILMIENISIEDLLTESGDDVDSFHLELIYDASITEHGGMRKNFRIKNLSKYVVKLIPEKLFYKGLKIFTQIKDVDSFLQSYYPEDYRFTNSEYYKIDVE